MNIKFKVGDLVITSIPHLPELHGHPATVVRLYGENDCIIRFDVPIRGYPQEKVFAHYYLTPYVEPVFRSFNIPGLFWNF